MPLFMPCLIAALIQIEKRASALVSAGEAAPEDPVAQYLARYPAADGIYSAFDYAHKVWPRFSYPGRLAEKLTLSDPPTSSDQQFSSVRHLLDLLDLYDQACFSGPVCQ